MSDAQELEQQLSSLLMAQHQDQRDLAVMKKLLAARSKEISALSDRIDDLRDGGE